MIKKIKDKRIVYFLLLTVIALVPSFVLRLNVNLSILLGKTFGTGLCDLLGFFAGRLQEGQKYPFEYPVGIRLFYEIFQFDKYQNYSQFFVVNAVILTLFALAITYLLYKILKAQGRFKDLDRVVIYWIAAPSLIAYGIHNYDLPVVFSIVLAVYLYSQKRYYSSVVSLAIGTVIKVFPIFLLPILVLKSPREKRIYLILSFILVWATFNLPYMLANFQEWIYPYLWQITENITASANGATYWWIFYPLLGKNVGVASLILFAILYIFTWIRLKKAPFADIALAVILVFLLTDRVYSAQYNLYLLPFLVLVTNRIDNRAFYLLEIPNAVIIFSLGFLITYPILFQILLFVKYIALIWLYVDNYKFSRKVG